MTWRALRQRLGCGFGAGLLVELSLSSTRWMSGAARTLHRRRRYDHQLWVVLYHAALAMSI